MSNIKQVMVCWNPGTDQVQLVKWPDRAGIQDVYALSMSWGACNSYLHKLSFEVLKCEVFIQAMHMVVRDKVNPEAVHKALLGLEEYRDGCADDMPGVNRTQTGHKQDKSIIIGIY